MSRLIFNQLTTTPSDTDAGSSQLYLKDNGGLYLKNASNTEVALLTGADTTSVWVSGNGAGNINYTGGNVGIGTNDPKTPLHIISTNTLGATFTGATHGEGITITQSDYTANNYVSLLESSYDDSSLPPCVRIGTKFTGGGSDLVFCTSNNFAGGITNQAVTIGSSGKVGIGTTVPSELLSVAGAVSATTTAKAWARWDGTGGAHAEVAGATYNVSSIAYNGTGNFTVNLTTPSGFGNGMCVVGSAGDSNYSSADTNLNFRHDVSSDSAIDVIIATDAGADHSDCDQICLVAFNTQ